MTYVYRCDGQFHRKGDQEEGTFNRSEDCSREVSETFEKSLGYIRGTPGSISLIPPTRQVMIVSHSPSMVRNWKCPVKQVSHVLKYWQRGYLTSDLLTKHLVSLIHE